MTAQLTDARVAVGSDTVTLAFTVDGELPGGGHHWLLSMTFIAGPDGPIRQLGIKMVDGGLASAFVFDHVSGMQFNYDNVIPQRVGTRWTAAFPIDALGSATSTSGRCRAALDVDGTDAGVIEGTF